MGGYRVRQYRQWADIRRTTGFRSKFEAEVSAAFPQDLDARYETLRLPYQITVSRLYLPDWILPRQAIVLEAKGRFSKEDRDKMLCIRHFYPYLDVRMVFGNLKAKVGRCLTVEDWCRRLGIPCCQGPGLPEAWINHRPDAKSRLAFDRAMKIMEFQNDE